MVPQPPAGILKKDWLLKHRTRVPAAVASMFRADQVSGDPSQWLQACSDLENLKSVIHGRNTKLVVILVQGQAGDELSEDVTFALRKRAEIDSKHLIVLVENNETEWNKSLNKLKSVFVELCSTYYKEEGRRIKARIEKRSFSSVELSIRYCLKLNSGKVVAVGPGERDRDGKLIPVALKEGDTVFLPEYGGLEVKLTADKEYFLFREYDILGFVMELCLW